MMYNHIKILDNEPADDIVLFILNACCSFLSADLNAILC